MNHARMWTALRRTLALDDAPLRTLGPERARERLAIVRVQVYMARIEQRAERGGPSETNGRE